MERQGRAAEAERQWKQRQVPHQQKEAQGKGKVPHPQEEPLDRLLLARHVQVQLPQPVDNTPAGDLINRRRVAPQSEVSRVIVLEESPCGQQAGGSGARQGAAGRGGARRGREGEANDSCAGCMGQPRRQRRATTPGQKSRTRPAEELSRSRSSDTMPAWPGMRRTRPRRRPRRSSPYGKVLLKRLPYGLPQAPRVLSSSSASLRTTTTTTTSGSGSSGGSSSSSSSSQRSGWRVCLDRSLVLTTGAWSRRSRASRAWLKAAQPEVVRAI